MNKVLSGLAVVLAFNMPGFVGAESCECEDMQERMQMLERRIQLLERRLGQKSIPEISQPPGAATTDGAPNIQPSTVPTVAVPPVPQTETLHQPSATLAQPAISAVGTGYGMVDARYYLFVDEGSFQTERDADAAGRIAFDGEVSFKPRDYGMEEGGLFSKYDDPTLYPASAVNISGQWQVEKSGVYRVVIRPKPAREGGGAVRGSLLFSLLIDGRVVIPETRTQGWHKVEKKMQLSAGTHRVELRALARSPGFGPSPTDTRMFIDVRGPREAAARPLVLSVP